MASPTISVESRGVRAYPLITRLAAAGFAAIGILLIADSAKATHEGEAFLIIGIAAVISAMVAGDLGLEEYFSNRWIEVTPDGVTAVYKFHRTSAPWSKLCPLKDALLNQTSFRFERGEGRRTQLIVTFEQMRAILAHPSCPKWTLSPALARRLATRSTAA